MSWPIVALGEIFEIARGGSPRPIDDYITDAPDGVNWISIKDASNSSKYITKTAKKILPSGVSRSREVKPGDFLLTNSMSFGRPYILRTSGCIHDGWLVLSGNDKVVDQDYFYHLLGSDPTYRKFKSLAAGAVVKNLNIDLVKTVKVPLPPVAEQRRIAAILDKSDALRGKRSEAIAKLDQLLQSVFLEMFGNPATNARGWRVSTIGDECDVGSGSTPSRQVEAYFEGNIPWVKSTEVNWGTIVETGERVSESGQKAARLRLYPAKTVVVALYGQGTTRGKCALLGIPATMNQACSGISPSKTVNPIYLFHYLRRCYERLRGESRGGNQANLNLGILKSFELPVPPLELQERFARIVAKWDAQNHELFQGADHMDKLFSSLQQRAFAGTL